MTSPNKQKSDERKGNQMKILRRYMNEVVIPSVLPPLKIIGEVSGVLPNTKNKAKLQAGQMAKISNSPTTSPSTQKGKEWEHEFDNEWNASSLDEYANDWIIDFIRELLHSERQKLVEEIRNIPRTYHWSDDGFDPDLTFREHMEILNKERGRLIDLIISKLNHE